MSCEQLVAAHTIALTAALACTPGAPHQCQSLAEVVPLACPSDDCQNYQYVNDNTEVNGLLKGWLAACGPSGDPCPDGVLDCGATAPRATCVATGSTASTGTCMPSPLDGGSGPGPEGGESCDELAADYATAVTASLACTPGAPAQCQAWVSPRLMPCNDDCVTAEAANDATAVTAIWQRWVTACAGTLVCPAIGCNPPPGKQGVCVPVDGGGIATGGLCVRRAARLK